MKLNEVEYTSGSRTERSELSIQEVIEKVPVAFKKYQEGARVYRGFKFNGTIAYGDSTQGEPRRSANASNNFYTIWMDEHPHWKNYPKRSRSFICSTAGWTAEGYGRKMVVLPVGDPVFGIVPNVDLWDTSMTSLNYVQNIYETLSTVFDLEVYFDTKHFQDISSLSELKNLMNYLSKEYKRYKEEIPSIDLYSVNKIPKHFELGNSLWRTLNRNLNPKRLGFETRKLSKFDRSLSPPSGYEVWFSGPAYFVDANYMKAEIGLTSTS